MFSGDAISGKGTAFQRNDIKRRETDPKDLDEPLFRPLTKQIWLNLKKKL